MNNFIELNLTNVRPVNAITNDLKVLRSNIALFPDEKADMPSKMISCIACGIKHTVLPIAANGYCRSCNELYNYNNY